MTAPERPPLRYHGGKWLLAPWIIQHFPAHRTYTEAFCGGLSVMMRKERAYAEVVNDLNEEVVTFFRVLQNPVNAARLRELLEVTPYARSEFELAYEPTLDPVEMSRRLVIRSLMGFGSDGHNAAVKTGFRADSDRSGSTPAHVWVGYAAQIPIFTARLSGVVIENRPALHVMKKADRSDALHYIDPPYLPETRSKKSRRGKTSFHAYTHEMTIDDHVEMLEAAADLVGMVVISGYPSDLYDEKLKGWARTEKKSLADGARPRTEVLWENPACFQALEDRRAGKCSPLFMERAAV